MPEETILTDADFDRVLSELVGQGSIVLAADLEHTYNKTTNLKRQVMRSKPTVQREVWYLMSTVLHMH